MRVFFLTTIVGHVWVALDLNMDDRISALGGTLEVRSHPGRAPDGALLAFDAFPSLSLIHI